jgi:hypothetical protein
MGALRPAMNIGLEPADPLFLNKIMLLRHLLTFVFLFVIAAAACSTDSGNKNTVRKMLNPTESDTLSSLAKRCSNSPDEIAELSQASVERLEKNGTKMTREAFMKRALSMIEGFSENDKTRLDEQGKIDYTLVAATIIQSVGTASPPANVTSSSSSNAPNGGANSAGAKGNLTNTKSK